MLDATAAILTLNSSKNLIKCLNSIKKFKEIIILDGGSVDQTLLIARKFNCRILKQDKKFQFPNKKISNFAAARNFILKKAKYELIFMIDSDETLATHQIKKIDYLTKSIINRNKYYCYLLPRIPILNNITYIKSNLNPNYQPRIFYKSKIDRYIKNVHETPIPVKKKLYKKKLENLYLKFSANLTRNDFYKKFNYYYEIEKKMMKKTNFFKSFRFIIFKLLNVFRMYLKFLFKNISNSNLKNYERNIINYNFMFSFKLLLNKFNIFD